MKALTSSLLLGCVAALLAGCETTGDPRSGGIFWSEEKGQQRLAERRSGLSNEQRGARRAAATTGNLRSQEAALQEKIRAAEEKQQQLQADTNMSEGDKEQQLEAGRQEISRLKERLRLLRSTR